MNTETANYRYYHRLRWQVLRSSYVAAVADAMDSGAVEAQARQDSARALRGDFRAFMSELLTHAPAPAVLAFLDAAQQWGDYGEGLLERGEPVLALVDTIELRGSWAAPASLDRQAAEDDARWQAWVQAWLDAVRVVGPAAIAAGDRPATSGENLTSRRWLPWVISAAAVVGTTVVVVLGSRE